MSICASHIIWLSPGFELRQKLTLRLIDIADVVELCRVVRLLLNVHRAVFQLIKHFQQDPVAKWGGLGYH